MCIRDSVNIVSNDVLDTEAFKGWRPEYATAEFILEDGKYILSLIHICDMNTHS